MTIFLRIFAVWASLLLTTISPSRAADRTIDLKVGAQSSLVLDQTFETVMIGDSNVVDVHTRDNRSVMFEPLAPGATNVVFLDVRNIVIANIAILVRQSTVNLVGRIP